MEKFGILNLLKALETLAPAAQKLDGDENARTAPAAETVQTEKTVQKSENELPNMMAQALLRHEEIANRVKNNRR